ncbi:MULTISPECIES: type II toxin-antitoxin system VapC family toxin [unclassified Frankia]|uniref:type II toxin-antitoxin system VapC family toxin n=1 Tax=unclassified Frankia TaxID=2632575 RepID=UPI001EF41877|nr:MULTISPECIES: type II toxin-antitoxin system VapC family toxin [unclassified Frankia]
MTAPEAVIDCSALIRTLTDHGPTGQAVRHRLAGLTTLAAPGLLDYELLSALFGMVRGRKLSAPEAEKAIGDYQRLPFVRHETLILWERVRDLHHNLSAYDAQYVALAEALGLPLITSDARLDRGAAATCSIEVFA